MTSKHGWQVPASDSQSLSQQPPQLESSNSLPYGLTSGAPPPPYSVNPYNFQPFPNNYQTPYNNSTFNSPLIPPPPYNPTFIANENPAQQNYFSFNQTQPPAAPPPMQIYYPSYPSYPQQNYGQNQPYYPNIDTNASLPPVSPSVSDMPCPSSPQRPPRPESIPQKPPRPESVPQRPPRPKLGSKGSIIGFEDSGSVDSSNGVYPDLKNNVSTTDSNDNHISQDHVRTPLPPNIVTLWDSTKTAHLYFVQQEGHVVSPNRDVGITAYKCPPMTDVYSYPLGSLAGHALNATVLLDVVDTWRLGLGKERSYIVRGMQDEFAFYDDSTSPARFVILTFPKGMAKAERQRLDVLLTGSSFLLDEPANFVDKIESGFGSVFNSVTQSADSAVKKQTPDFHKSTKWLRKGTGQVVRFGGNLVSKGVHLVSDNVMDKDAPKEAATQHHELFKALKTYREALEKKKVTKV